MRAFIQFASGEEIELRCQACDPPDPGFETTTTVLMLPRGAPDVLLSQDDVWIRLTNDEGEGV